MTEPTEWVSSIVIVKKPNSEKLRICIDPTDLNEAINRPIFHLPTIEEVLPQLKKSKIFSVMDASNGFCK